MNCVSSRLCRSIGRLLVEPSQTSAANEFIFLSWLFCSGAWHSFTRREISLSLKLIIIIIMIISIQTHDVQALSLFSPGWNILTCFHKQENRIRRTLSRNTRSGYVRLTNVAARLRVYIHNLMSCNKPNCFVWVNNVWISSSSDSVFSTDRHLWLRFCSQSLVLKETDRFSTSDHSAERKKYRRSSDSTSLLE